MRNAFVKKVDKVEFGPFKVSSCTMDFCVIDLTGKVNGLLGLDLLSSVGTVIDLKNTCFFGRLHKPLLREMTARTVP